MVDNAPSRRAIRTAAQPVRQPFTEFLCVRPGELDERTCYLARVGHRAEMSGALEGDYLAAVDSTFEKADGS